MPRVRINSIQPSPLNNAEITGEITLGTPISTEDIQNYIREHASEWTAESHTHTDDTAVVGGMSSTSYYTYVPTDGPTIQNLTIDPSSASWTYSPRVTTTNNTDNVQWTVENNQMTGAVRFTTNGTIRMNADRITTGTFHTGEVIRTNDPARVGTRITTSDMYGYWTGPVEYVEVNLKMPEKKEPMIQQKVRDEDV